MAAALNVPVNVMETAGEGGAWGIALFASYIINKDGEESLVNFLEKKVFAEQAKEIVAPDPSDDAGFNKFMKLYKQ
jgi:sugar (pentulose or hexulose) kinase